MHRSPTFLFLYLPWIAGVVLMLLVLPKPFDMASADDNVYHASHHPLSPPAEQLIKLVSISPRFAGCPDMPGKDECARQRLEAHLYGSVSFPADPDNKGTAGLVVISFEVSRSGRMGNVDILKDPGYGRGADALRIVTKMAAEEVRWEPATVNGKATPQRVYVKIRYSNFQWAS